MLGANLSKYLESIQDEVTAGEEVYCAVIVLSHLSLARKHSIKDDFGLTIFEQAVYETHVSRQTEFMFSENPLVGSWMSQIALRRQLDINDSKCDYHNESLCKYLAHRDYQYLGYGNQVMCEHKALIEKIRMYLVVVLVQF